MKETIEQRAVDKFAAEHTKFEWDSIHAWTPTWQDIQGKAHLYKVAQRREDGEFVGLKGVTSYAGQPAFRVRDEKGEILMHPNQLCNFTL